MGIESVLVAVAVVDVVAGRVGGVDVERRKVGKEEEREEEENIESGMVERLVAVATREALGDWTWLSVCFEVSLSVSQLMDGGVRVEGFLCVLLW